MRLTRLTLFALVLAAVPSVTPAQTDPRDSVAPTALPHTETVTDTLGFELRASSVLPGLSLELAEQGETPEGPAFPIEFMLAGLATARKTGGKKKVGDSVDKVPTPKPPATQPLTSAQRAAIKTEQETVAAARVPTADPEQSDNVKETGKFDETVPGGRTIGTDKKVRNADGEIIK